MMTGDDVRALVHQHLGKGGLHNQSGSILYSGIDTLRPGSFYLMGLNPAGEPTDDSSSIASSIHERRNWSAYTGNCWVSDCAEPAPCSHLDQDGRVKEAHLGKHQKNVGKLISALGPKPEEIFATNAIFARSKDEKSIKSIVKGMGTWDWWEACWQVHEQFLREVRPRWIITLGKGFGSTAFAFLMDKAKVKRSHVRSFGDDSKTDGRWFVADLPLGGEMTLPVRVLGMPHPSYCPISDSLAEAMRVQAAAILSSMVAKNDPRWSPASAPPAKVSPEAHEECLLRFGDGFHATGYCTQGSGDLAPEWTTSVFGLDEEGRHSHPSTALAQGPTHWMPVPNNWKALMDAAWGADGYN